MESIKPEAYSLTLAEHNTPKALSVGLADARNSSDASVLTKSSMVSGNSIRVSIFTLTLAR